LKERLKYFFAAIGSSAMWGFFSVPLRSLKEFPSQEILIYRIFTSLLICVIITLLFRRKKVKQDIAYLQIQPKEKRKNIFWLIIVSSIFITANWFSFIFAVNHISVQSGAFAYMVCPIITALLGFFILKEKLGWLKWISIIICIASISILALSYYRDVAFSIIIALLYAVYLILQKKIEGINKFNILLVQLVISTILILPFYYADTNPFPAESNFWITIFVISVFFTIIPLFLSLYALIGLPSSTIGILIYMNPIVAFFVALFYFHEKISTHQIISYTMLIVAIILFNWNIIKGFFSRAYPNENNS
jgi:chloramphenicol-sensitive protein RarD